MKLAWLVTWETRGDGVDPPPRGVAAILLPHISSQTVQRLMERIYAYECYDEAELLECARDPGHNPYRAVSEVVDGYRFLVTCGDNPYLRARYVSDLNLQSDEDGVRRLAWVEQPEASNPFAMSRTTQ